MDLSIQEVDVPKASHELGLVSRLNAEAVGEPGKRTFRLLVDSAVGSAVLWLEKEQLLELSLSIKRAAAMIEEEESEASLTQSASSSGDMSVEFKIGKQSIEYDREARIFRFWNHDIEAGEEEEATLVFEATSAQVSDLSEEGLRVCASGRPICPLCHQPINPEGHFCDRSNGHPSDASERLE